jgi:acetyl esterase
VETRSIVINCNYRLCPENKYPLPAFDAYAIYKHIVEQADHLGIDRSRIIISGDSAGACLAMNIAMMLAQNAEQTLARLIVLIHPMIGNHFVNNQVPIDQWANCERNFSHL